MAEDLAALAASAEADAASDATEPKTNEEGSKPAFDAEALAARLAEVQESTATKAEIEGLRRQAGHVPALQSELATLKAEVQKNRADADRLDALELLLTEVLPAEMAADIESKRARRTQEAAESSRFEELESRILGRLDEVAPKRSQAEEPTDPGIAAYQAAAVEATQAIHAYATERGIDPTEIPAVVYTSAQEASGGDLTKASQAVAAWIDQQAASKDAEARRAERAEDAKGGSPATRAGATGQFDLNTLTGLTQARNAGAIDSAQFIEGWRRLRGGI